MNKYMILMPVILALTLSSYTAKSDVFLLDPSWSQDLIKPGDEVIASVRAAPEITHATIKIWEKVPRGRADRLIKSQKIVNDGGWIQMSWVYNCSSNPAERPVRIPVFYFTAESDRPRSRITSRDIIVRDTFDLLNIDGVGRRVDDEIFFVLEGTDYRGNIIHRIKCSSNHRGRAAFPMMVPCIDYRIFPIINEKDYKGRESEWQNLSEEWGKNLTPWRNKKSK